VIDAVMPVTLHSQGRGARVFNPGGLYGLVIEPREKRWSSG
jgi:hypothetical protein